MKKTKIFYWVFTGLFAAMMIFSAIPDVISEQKAVEMINKLLGYPGYFLPFIGVAKVLGAIAILIPGFPRIKEWAYAGLFFDLIGATYSMIAIGTPVSGWLFMLLPLGLGILSYFFYHKLLRQHNLLAYANRQHSPMSGAVMQ